MGEEEEVGGYLGINKRQALGAASVSVERMLLVEMSF